jgi:transcriptional regulator with XRE-family HTH domain
VAERLNSLAARLRWARTEQAVTLHQLSDRSGRAVSYLSQLEHGVRENPTKETIDSLARALGVRPAFLFGEVPRPPFDEREELAVRSQAFSVRPRFLEYWNRLPEPERTHYQWAEPAARFCLIVRFLLYEMAGHFNRLELAWQLGMSLAQFDDVMEGRGELSTTFMEQLSFITGVPVHFLTMGTIDEEGRRPGLDREEAFRLTAYMRVFLNARTKGITPQQLEAMIAAAYPRRNGR